MSDVMNIGDLVKAIPPFTLHCASSAYDRAVVTQVEPLVMISEVGDMVWTKVEPAYVETVGKADHRAMCLCIDRLNRDNRLAEQQRAQVAEESR